ncbi:Peptidyl-dipeptidase [Spironucleus salmonicida]|uniref:Peptidyl-dipeptidase n=1 Tax=Spironucleus salmonicida TaxID=348837 RepID=V6LR31_9EUKA|nr:Peptidyl-dipeptidase [Spironucleus salmonicida]|eukprot:EST47142.1 Peptidyl-dipeptidase [Spironucleus salmonicida]
MDDLLKNVYNNNINWKLLDEDNLIQSLNMFEQYFVNKLNSIQIIESIFDLDELLAQVKTLFLFSLHLNQVLGYIKFFAFSSVILLQLEKDTLTQYSQFIKNYKSKNTEESRFLQIQRLQLQKLNSFDILQLQQLKNQFSQNIVQELHIRQLILDASKFNLDGLDEIYQCQFIKNSIIILNASLSVSTQVMTYASDENLRKQYWLFLQNKNLDNEQNIKKQIVLKQKMSQQHGFDSTIDYMLQGRMVSSKQQLTNFYNNIYDKIKPSFDKDILDLQLISNNNLQPWNLTYYFEKLIQKEIFDIKSVLKFFPKKKFINNIILFLQSKLNIIFDLITDLAWADDVFGYNIKINDVKNVQLYFDLYQRDKKQQGGWFQQISSKIFSIQANFPSQTKYFEYNEAHTILHELGHALHGMYGESIFKSQTSLDIPWDFVEIPSQFFENFLENEQFLLQLSQDDDGQKLTSQQLNNIIKRNKFRNSISIMRQIELGQLDLELHENFKGGDLDEFIKDITNKYNIFPQIQKKSIVRSFNHIFGNSHDYTCGYYSYLWSNVFSSFLFDAFLQEQDLQTFVENILSVGNAQDPAISIYNYAGECSLDPYFNRMGLK